MIQSLGIRRRLRKRRALRKVAASIRTHTTTRERETLYLLALQCAEPRNVLEIGSYLGASTVCLAAGLMEIGRGALFCVDTWENETMPEGDRETFQDFVSNTWHYRRVISTIRKRNDELGNGDVPSDISLAFIDGDHAYAVVQNDVQTIKPWLTDGVIVAFHDAKYFPGVSKVIGECLESGFWQLQGAVDNLAWLKFFPGGIDDFGINLDGKVNPTMDA